MNLFWRIQRKFRKYVIANSKNPHPSSYPFISGDGFRELADHLYDMTSQFDPSLVKPRDIVFVRSDYMDRYFQKLHPLIKNPYILITHNGDRNISEKELLYIDQKIVHWFAQNVLVNHPKVTPIPIGLENASYANAGYVGFYSAGIPKNKNRIPRVLVSFNVESNRIDRQQALDSLRSASVSDITNSRMEQPKYVETTKKYCFVASPPGNGEDCIRTWEAMLLGAIPIVKRSLGIESFKSLGLPLHVIDSWDEIKSMTEYDLRQKYDLIISQAKNEALYMDYWKDLINKQK